MELGRTDKITHSIKLDNYTLLKRDTGAFHPINMKR